MSDAITSDTAPPVDVALFVPCYVDQLAPQVAAINATVPGIVLSASMR